MILEGRLVGAESGYAGHSVELSGAFLVPGLEGETPQRFRAVTADKGGFALDFGSAKPADRPLSVLVRGPDGCKLLEEEAAAGTSFLKLGVAPVPPVEVVVTPDPLDPARGPFTLRLRLIDRATNRPAAGRLAALWGRGAPGSGGEGEPPRAILAADYSDTDGTVRLVYPRVAYGALEVELPGTTGGPATRPVPVGRDGLPAQEMTVVASFPEEEAAEAEEDDCACHDPAPPRTPDYADLVSTEGVYSADLGGGTCPTPAIANRTIEEYRYYTLVRTTDPALFGVRVKPVRPLSDQALGLLAELAYGFGSMDAKLADGSDAEAPVPGGAGFRPEAGSLALDRVRLASRAYVETGLLAARAWREMAKGTDPRKEIMARAADLSEDALRHALADPDGFTPVSLMTAERFDAIERVRNQVRLFQDAAKGRAPISPDNMPRWDEAEGSYQAATVAHGHILEWRQVWRADGYSLGDLLYSLPLAPGQKRKVAVIDWDRAERASRTESRSFAESFAAGLSRNRTVSEVVNSTVTESIRAGSSTNTWGAGGGLGLGVPFSGGFFGLGVAGGGGGSSSTAWQDSARALSASAGQQLSDRVSQASSAVRSQRATVVVGSRQSESLSITSEIVANYNHCHAMTVEYFEVLQHFRVDQELANVRECLFIPLIMKPFDMYKALRWRDILEPRLRRPEWAKGFGAIERILLGYADTGYPPGRYADEPIREMSGELRLQLSITRPRDLREGEDIATYLLTAWDFWENLFGAGTAQKVYDSTIEERRLADRIFASEHAPRVARAFAESLTFTLVVADPVTGTREEPLLLADVTMASDYRAGGLHLVSFRATEVPANVTRAMVRAIRVAASVPGLSPNSTTLLRMANVLYATDYAQHVLVPDRWMRNDILDGDHAQISTVSLSRDEERNPREEDRESLAGLLKHLNEFVEHYHQVIWWRMDPNRRFMLLDGFIAPNSGDRSLASVVENRLISIVGNALIMPVAPGYQLDPLVRLRTEEGGPVDLLEVYRPPIPFPPKRIALPTRGVHAEAILGECDSCEIRDDTRFWDWASEPIPNNEPTPIAEISTATRRQEPADTTPSPLPAPIVAIQNAPAAPEPLSISTLTDLLGRQGLFKDITGLEGNQANAVAAFEQSLKTANAFGKLAASGAKATLANRSGERVMRKVQEAEASGLLSKDDAKQVVSRLFGVMNGEAADTDAPLSQDPAVKEALGNVNAAPGQKSIKVTSGTGSTSQTVETKTGAATPGGGATVVDFRIEGVPPLMQPSPLSCWAVALTMLISHQRQQSLAVETALLEGGQSYVDLFKADTGLRLNQVARFRADFGLSDVSFGALTAAGIEAVLKTHGPLWVIADEDGSPGFSVHARVVTGITGDGTPSSTQLTVNDPAVGKEVRESLAAFADKVAQLSQGAVATFGGVSPTVLAF